jgi:hypothetical protein
MQGSVKFVAQYLQDHMPESEAAGDLVKKKLPPLEMQHLRVYYQNICSFKITNKNK